MIVGGVVSFAVLPVSAVAFMFVNVLIVVPHDCLKLSADVEENAPTSTYAPYAMRPRSAISACIMVQYDALWCAYCSMSYIPFCVTNVLPTWLCFGANTGRSLEHT